jgi:hypothetical protein
VLALVANNRSVMRFGGKRMRLKVLLVKTLSPPARVGFITVKDRTLTPLAERFIDCARKVAKIGSRSRAEAAPVVSAVTLTDVSRHGTIPAAAPREAAPRPSCKLSASVASFARKRRG